MSTLSSNSTHPAPHYAAIFQYITDIKNQIIDIATQKGMNPSGKTLSSLQVAETPSGYELLANPGIYFAEHGRGPTHPGTPAGNPKLVEVIQDWLNAKGLDINPYAVANTIHKHGTKLYRSGGNSGVLSIPLNLDKLDEVFGQLSAQYLNSLSADIYQPINNF